MDRSERASHATQGRQVGGAYSRWCIRRSRGRICGAPMSLGSSVDPWAPVIEMAVTATVVSVDCTGADIENVCVPWPHIEVPPKFEFPACVQSKLAGMSASAVARFGSHNTPKTPVPPLFPQTQSPLSRLTLLSMSIHTDTPAGFDPKKAGLKVKVTVTPPDPEAA